MVVRGGAWGWSRRPVAWVLQLARSWGWRALRAGSGIARRLRSVGLEEGDHGEDAAVVVVGLVQVQLGEDGADVLLDGAFGDPQPPGDADVGASLGHQGEHLVFPRAEYGERVVAAAGG